MKSIMRRMPALLVAALLAVGAHSAAAQPGGGHGHGRGHWEGAGFERVLASIKGQLNLNTSQQVMWDNAVAQAKAARETGRTNHQGTHAALSAELAKAEPDFAAVAAAFDDAQARNQALRKQVRDEFLKLYATFTPAQKAVVRDAAAQRLARHTSWREKMQERMPWRSKSS